MTERTCVKCGQKLPKVAKRRTVVNVDVVTYSKIATLAEQSNRGIQGQLAWLVENAPKEVITRD